MFSLRRLILGRKYAELIRWWIPSASFYGSTFAVGVCYFTDWKVVLQYLPYYRGKFVNDE